MPILNYTTSIKVEKTVGEIQAALAMAGAKAVLFEFDGPVVEAISFRIEYNGELISFRLPSNIESIFRVLRDDPNVPRKLRSREQASRVAWRIIKVWLLAQLAIVEAEQAEMVQVFLPYAQHPESGQTVFENMQDGGLKRLSHGC
jgi:hypothetical protein